jgi:hypothetical protein
MERRDDNKRTYRVGIQREQGGWVFVYEKSRGLGRVTEARMAWANLGPTYLVLG